jgi:hypothetical protein
VPEAATKCFSCLRDYQVLPRMRDGAANSHPMPLLPPVINTVLPESIIHQASMRQSADVMHVMRPSVREIGRAGSHLELFWQQCSDGSNR